jgi:hypothetical protein
MREAAFNLAKPDVSRQEAQAARDARKIVLGLRVTAFRVVDGVIELVAVKFALANGSSETLLLDEVSARALGADVSLLKDLGWQTDALQPKGSAH